MPERTNPLTAVERVDCLRGRMGLHYLEGGEDYVAGREADVSFVHSLSVLDRIMSGRISVNGSTGRRREIYDAFSNRIGPERIEQNIACLFLHDHPIYFESPKFGNGFAPMPKEDLKRVNESDYNQEIEKRMFESLDYHRKGLHVSAKAVLETDPNGRGHKNEVLRMVGDYNDVSDFSERLCSLNVGLVYWACEKSRFFIEHGDDALSAGFESLHDCVTNGFDVNKNCKFSTYFCKSTLNEFAKIYERRKKGEQKFLPEFLYPADHREKFELEDKEEELKRKALVGQIIDGNAAELGELEMSIIRARFGLHEIEKTLKECGEKFGLTKERIRKIQDEAQKRIGRYLNRRRYN